MPIVVNTRHLASRNLHLKGELPVAELEIDQLDDVIQLRQPLEYDLEVERLDDAILARGSLYLNLDCECVRCLKPLKYEIDLPDWAVHLPLVGDEKVLVVNDCVDLTGLIREDILLAFPQHPLCKPECGGLAEKPGKGRQTTDKNPKQGVPSAWTELDKLKL